MKLAVVTPNGRMERMLKKATVA